MYVYYVHFTTAFAIAERQQYAIIKAIIQHNKIQHTAK